MLRQAKDAGEAFKKLRLRVEAYGLGLQFGVRAEGLGFNP